MAHAAVRGPVADTGTDDQDVRVLVVAVGVFAADELRPALDVAKHLAVSGRAKVSFVTHPRYRSLVRACGVSYQNGGLCPYEAKRETLDAQKTRLFRSKAEVSHFNQVVVAEWCQAGHSILARYPVDLLLLATHAATWVYPVLAEAFSLSFAILADSPVHPNAEFGPPRGFADSETESKWVNDIRWRMHAKATWQAVYRDAVNPVRASYGLEPDTNECGPWDRIAEGEEVPTVLCYSQVLLPRPFTWGPHIHTVGPVLFEPEHDASGAGVVMMPPEFAKFLSGSDGAHVECAVVDLGDAFFNDKSLAENADLLSTILRGLDAAGLKAIVIAPRNLEDHGVLVLAIEDLTAELPHMFFLHDRPPPRLMHALLSRFIKVVVCGGQPAVVHSALRMGVPLLPIVITTSEDESNTGAFWADRVASVGASPKALISTGLRSQHVAEHLARLINPESTERQAAAAVARAMQSECQAARQRIVDVVQSLAAPFAKIRRAASAAVLVEDQEASDTFLLGAESAEQPSFNATVDTKQLRKRQSRAAWLSRAESSATRQPEQPGTLTGASDEGGGDGGGGGGDGGDGGDGSGSEFAGLEAADDRVPPREAALQEGDEGVHGVVPKRSPSFLFAPNKATQTMAPFAGQDHGPWAAGFSMAHRRMDGAAADRAASAPMQRHAWEEGDHTRFKLRVGPNYKRSGKKAPSAAPLYELLGFDMIRSNKQISRVPQHFRLPEVQRQTRPPVPALWVVNGSLPLEPPTMSFSSVADGETVNAIFYFGIKEDTLRQLDDLESASPAVRLLHRYCDGAADQPDVFNRFKCVGMVRNYEEVGLPSMFKGYNGKPVLIRNRQAIRNGSGHLSQSTTNSYMEMHVNIRLWAYLAKQGLSHLLGNVDQCDLDIGFVLEGRTDDEMPETLLGCAHVVGVDLQECYAANV